MALAEKKSPFWVAAAIVLLVPASAAAGARTRTVESSARVPWPVRCQRLFGLPRGRVDYLVPYRGLAQYLFEARGIWVRPRRLGA